MDPTCAPDDRPSRGAGSDACRRSLRCRDIGGCRKGSFFRGSRHVRRDEFAQVEMAQARSEVRVDHGAGVAHLGGRPAQGSALEPLIEQIADRPDRDSAGPASATSSSGTEGRTSLANLF